MEYILHILILIGIYATLSISLNLVVGYTGLLSISHAASFGIGAYVAAILALNLQSPFLLNILCAVILSCLAGVLVGISTLRIRDDYFVMATFAFQVITFSILNNWIPMTGGPLGLPGIPQPALFGLKISSHIGFLVLVSASCTLVFWITRRIVRSPFGRVLKSIREDEVFAHAAGKNVAVFKVLVFVISTGMAGMAGAMYAYYISFIDPTSFTVLESIFLISIVIIGGAGSLWGPVLGAAVLVILPEILRFVGLPSSEAANIRQILYGALLVAFMIWRPRGLLGKYAFQRKEILT